MNRTLRFMLAAMLTGTLAACSAEQDEEEYAMTVESTTDNTIEITADNAAAGTALSGYLTVGDNEHLVVETSLDKGTLVMRFVPGDGVDADHMPDFEGKDLPNPPVDYELTGNNSTEYSLEAGEFYFLFTVKEPASGTVHIYTRTADTGEDGQNPVMNFIGRYGLDRASVLVEAGDGNTARFTVHWSSSAAEYAEWVMSGELDTDTLTVDYTDCVKTVYVFNPDGTVASSETIYENGTGTVTFLDQDPLSMTWEDAEEHIADGSVFTWIPAAE